MKTAALSEVRRPVPVPAASREGGSGDHSSRQARRSAEGVRLRGGVVRIPPSRTTRTSSIVSRRHAGTFVRAKESRSRQSGIGPNKRMERPSRASAPSSPLILAVREKGGCHGEGYTDKGGSDGPNGHDGSRICDSRGSARGGGRGIL